MKTKKRKSIFTTSPEYLFNNAIDLDFIDNDSLERAEIHGNELHVSGEIYRVLVLPSVNAIKNDILEKIAAFYHSGGIVIAYGRLPEAGDRTGKNDPEIDKTLEEVFGLTASEARQKDTIVQKKNPAGGTGAFVPHNKNQKIERIQKKGLPPDYFPRFARWIRGIHPG